jgi:hypothetical protein
VLRPLADPVTEAIFREIERRFPDDKQQQWLALARCCDVSWRRFQAWRSGRSYMTAREVGFALDGLGFRLVAPDPAKVDPNDLLPHTDSLPMEELKRRSKVASDMQKRYNAGTARRRLMQVMEQGGPLPTDDPDGA